MVSKSIASLYKLGVWAGARTPKGMDCHRSQACHVLGELQLMKDNILSLVYLFNYPTGWLPPKEVFSTFF